MLTHPARVTFVARKGVEGKKGWGLGRGKGAASSLTKLHIIMG